MPTRSHSHHHRHHHHRHHRRHHRRHRHHCHGAGASARAIDFALIYVLDQSDLASLIERHPHVERALYVGAEERSRCMCSANAALYAQSEGSPPQASNSDADSKRLPPRRKGPLYADHLGADSGRVSTMPTERGDADGGGGGGGGGDGNVSCYSDGGGSIARLSEAASPALRAYQRGCEQPRGKRERRAEGRMQALGWRLDQQAEMINLALRQLGVDYKPTEVAEELKESSSFASLAEEGLGWRFDQQAEMLRLMLQRLGVSDKSVDAAQASSSLAAFIGRHRGGIKAQSKALQWRASAAASREPRASQRASVAFAESSPEKTPEKASSLAQISSALFRESTLTSHVDSPTGDDAPREASAQLGRLGVRRVEGNTPSPTSPGRTKTVHSI